MAKIELYHDNFQNYKRYNIPKAQLVIADIPYNLGVNAYASNPAWYIDGDNKKGESQKAGKALQRPDIRPGRTVQKLGMSDACSGDSESPLWPRPTTGAPLCGGTGNFKQMEKLRDSGIITEEERRNLTSGNGGNSNPALMEWLMGFPIGWTDLDA